ncbi:hypothetical protein F3Y22_tig00002919pilonHSYRG00087 [Hibiscus syriacus]|uniref:Uncharacterized protein n=1 Tax=Hibiscus syriacus TaxID=106335 RepID=A0A6A3CTR5_HIBSY|nr:hypothetical protein F3Y22_tig00002919pilonHSYRG00087 [Hibiscus syriacus]
MWRKLAVLRRNLQNIKKSRRVTDENVVVGGGGGGNNNTINGDEMPNVVGVRRSHGSWNGLSVVCSVVRAPFSLFSCFPQPRVNGADGFWVSNHESAQISEMNHLMVSDGMRYAILM